MSILADIFRKPEPAPAAPAAPAEEPYEVVQLRNLEREIHRLEGELADVRRRLAEFQYRHLALLEGQLVWKAPAITDRPQLEAELSGLRKEHDQKLRKFQHLLSEFAELRTRAGDKYIMHGG